MKLEQQVTSLEISKRLKELGVKQESLFAWYLFKGFVPNKGGTWSLVAEHEEEWKGTFENKCSAFTVTELGEFCKQHVDKFTNIPSHILNIEESDKSFIENLFSPDWLSKGIIYLLENNLIPHSE